MKFSELTEAQQLTIHPFWRRDNPGLPVSELDNECEIELWRYFLQSGPDPDDAIAFYYLLFDPNYQAKLDVFDKLWTIFNLQNNLPLANIYVLTGRLDELNKLLQEYSDGLSKKE